MSEAKAIRVYGLEVVGVEPIDLRTCYVFYPPNNGMDDLFGDRCMELSPHVEICKLYLKQGARWLRRNYQTTRYGQMMDRLGKKNFPQKIIDICESVREGYLCKGYEGSYIVVLREPFAASRYLRQIPNRVPEIWSGHHRAAALLAFGRYMVDVLVARDGAPGSKFSVGKVHGLCLGEP